MIVVILVIGTSQLEWPGHVTLSNPHVVECPLPEAPRSFVVNPRGGHVPVTDEPLRLNDNNTGVQEQRRGPMRSIA
jgi:hypothetical protein